MNEIKVENYKVKRKSLTHHEFKSFKDARHMYDRLYMLAMSVFEWENLPLTIDEVYLERTIIKMGSIVFFKDDDMVSSGTSLGIDGEYLALRYMPSYRLDVYGTPVVRRAYADNYARYRKNLTEDDSVIIYDNVLKISLDEIIYDFAIRLSNIKNVIDLNLQQQKMPYIIGANEQLKQQMEEFFRQLDSNKPYFIVKDSMLDTLRDAFNVFPISTDLIVNELQDYYNAIWNEFMVLVGIGTNASPKRERLVAGEVDGVNEQSQAFANARLKSRQRACKLINEKFDLDVKVRFSFDKQEGVGEEDGKIHDQNTRSPEKPDVSPGK